MKGEITLRRPMTLGERKRETLRYDTDKITLDQFEAAQRRSGAKVDSMIEMDYTFHAQIGIAAVCAAEEGVIPEDVANSLSGFDIMQLAKIGRDFTLGTSDEGSEDTPSGAPDGITPVSSTPESAN